MNQQRTLVISGASRGIGKATAELFLQKGYRVINLSRSRPAIDNIEHLPVDLADPDSVDSLSSSLAAMLGAEQIITVVHNAGLLRKDSVGDLPAAEFRRVLQVNVVAPSQLNQLLLPVMAAGSSILYVGSTLSEKGVANTCSYVTSKHAVLGLMRASCQDLRGRAIQTACICPGFTKTEMLSEHVGGSDEILDQIAATNTFGRLIEPEEIAKTLFLPPLTR